MRVKLNTRVVEKGPGFAKLVDAFGGLATITFGVQGEEALKLHPGDSGLTVGQVAAIHELGLSGGHHTARSWLTKYFDGRQKRLVQEAAAATSRVVKGQTTRKKAFGELGYKWVEEIQKRFDRGEIRPGLKQSTIDRKGHAKPLLDTGAVRNGVTFKLYLPPHGGSVVVGESRYVQGVSQAHAAKPGTGLKEQTGLPQPPKKVVARLRRPARKSTGALRAGRRRANYRLLRYAVRLLRKAVGVPSFKLRRPSLSGVYARRGRSSKGATSYRNHGFKGVRGPYTGRRGRSAR